MMNVTRELLTAYADGELDEVTARGVERAVAADPDLARQLEAERALRGRLEAHFAPLADEPVPASWSAMIAASAAEDAKVVSLADARAAREARGLRPRYAGFAIAASLVLGVLLGTQLVSGGSGPVIEKDGRLLASADLAHALDHQLASDGQAVPVKMLASFRRADGDYCRAFSGTTAAGIACRQDGAWQLERLQPGDAGKTAQYAQAGSTDAQLMAAAQDMAAGDPLDAAQEKAARDKGWR